MSLVAGSTSSCRALVGVESLSVSGDGGPDAALCDFSPTFDASLGRMQCVSGCLAGHTSELAAFFVGNGNIKLCICGACQYASSDGPGPCGAFCDSTCNTPNVPACNDCASHVLVDDGGACNDLQNLTCGDGGCSSLSTCIAQCPPT